MVYGYIGCLYVSDSGNHRIRKIAFPKDHLGGILVEDIKKLQGTFMGNAHLQYS